jgi:hypothetical protein
VRENPESGATPETIKSLPIDGLHVRPDKHAQLADGRSSRQFNLIDDSIERP